MQEHVRIIQDVAKLVTSGSDLARAEARRIGAEREPSTKACSHSVQDQPMPSVRRIPMWPGRRILEVWKRGLLDEPPVNELLQTQKPEAISISTICLSLIL
jgi:hypothetical protein